MQCLRGERAIETEKNDVRKARIDKDGGADGPPSRKHFVCRRTGNRSIYSMGSARRADPLWRGSRRHASLFVQAAGHHNAVVQRANFSDAVGLISSFGDLPGRPAMGGIWPCSRASLFPGRPLLPLPGLRSAPRPAAALPTRRGASLRASPPARALPDASARPPA